MSEATEKKHSQSILPIIPDATKDELAVALYLSVKDVYTVKQGASDLRMSEEDFRGCLAFWRGAGVFFGCKEQAEPVLPQERDIKYTTKELASSLEHDQAFNQACASVANILNKMLYQKDYDSLLYLYDHCGLTPEYLCALASYCVDKGKTTLHYFVKTATSLVEEGIDTYGKLEKHFEVLNKAKDRESKLRAICGMGARAFTAREEGYVNDWFVQKDLPFDLIKHAYEITVNAIGEAKLSYMNKIITRWHSEGITTLEQAQNAEAEKASKTKEEDKQGTSFDGDEFFAAAVLKTKKKRESRK